MMFDRCTCLKGVPRLSSPLTRSPFSGTIDQETHNHDALHTNHDFVPGPAADQLHTARTTPGPAPGAANGCTDAHGFRACTAEHHRRAYRSADCCRNSRTRYHFGPDTGHHIRITLVDAQPHPNPACPGWGWAPDRDTFVDPYGMTQDPCRVEHSLSPQGDGAGTTLFIGWGYNAGTTLAIGAAGSYLGNVTPSFLAAALPWPGNLGPADRPDFSQPLYQSLGAAHKEDGRWVWRDPFAEIVPTGP